MDDEQSSKGGASEFGSDFPDVDPLDFVGLRIEHARSTANECDIGEIRSIETRGGVNITPGDTTVSPQRLNLYYDERGVVRRAQWG
jgi:hypothetical protein